MIVRVAVVLALLCQAARGDVLEEALRRGDGAAVAEEARRAGASGLLRRMEGKDRKAALAAILAAPRSEQPWLLLPALIARMAAPDRAIAAAAARAVSSIARGLAPDVAPPAEIEPDLLEAARAGCRDVVLRAELAPDVRVAALECAAALGDVPAVLGDREPEVRRAAIYFTDDDAAVAKLIDDPDPAVAATAAAVLCPRKAIPAGAAARLATLALAPEVEPGLVVAMLSCLDAPTRATLAKKGPRVVKESLRRR